MCHRIGCSIKMRNKTLLLPAWCQWPQPLVKPQQDASRWGDKAQLNWTKHNITTRFQITMLIWIQPITLCSNFKEWESGLTGKESVSHSCLDLKFKNLFPTWKVDNTCQENVNVQNMRRYLYRLYSAVYKEQYLDAQMIYIGRLYQGVFWEGWNIDRQRHQTDRLAN